uniref:Uncharacterized protein n=1 Tax=Grammatophora oceanica TaxID=210454 RepID=A0A7S1UU54_9STRA|mmetsp:Transcript_193/g.251  ORF Transcript_193/g.251 Transcript_193/m.251 type:complete len:112 (+) Transcript_193:31-366(+)
MGYLYFWEWYLLTKNESCWYGTLSLVLLLRVLRSSLDSTFCFTCLRSIRQSGERYGDKRKIETETCTDNGGFCFWETASAEATRASTITRISGNAATGDTTMQSANHPSRW